MIRELSFQLKRGDPVTEVEFDRSCVGCELRRIHRQAEEVCTPSVIECSCICQLSCSSLN